jgi:hypothetical protein
MRLELFRNAKCFSTCGCSANFKSHESKTCGDEITDAALIVNDENP